MSSGREKDPWRRPFELLASTLDLVARGHRSPKEWMDHLNAYARTDLDMTPTSLVVSARQAVALQRAIDQNDHQGWGDHLHAFVFARRVWVFDVDYDDVDTSTLQEIRRWTNAMSSGSGPTGRWRVTAVLHSPDPKATPEEIWNRQMANSLMIPTPTMMIAFGRAFPQAAAHGKPFCGFIGQPVYLSGRLLHIPGMAISSQGHSFFGVPPEARFQTNDRLLFVVRVEEITGDSPPVTEPIRLELAKVKPGS